MDADHTPSYELLERTVDVHARLTETQFHDIHRLLDQVPGRFKTWPDAYLFDLTDAPDFDRVLLYLRQHELPHTVSEERRWSPTPRE